MTLASGTFRAAWIGIAAMALGATPARAETVLRVAAQQMPLYQALPYNPVAQPQALFVQMIYDPLTVVGEGGIAKPGLASAWTQESANRWVLTLRPGVRFSNGEAFTSAAVVDALTYLMTPEGQRDSVASQDIGKTIERVSARDDLTVELVTRSPDPILPVHLSFVRVPAPAAWRKAGRSGFATQPIGTGPFAVTSWSPEKVSFRAVRDSWRAPKVDGIEVNIVTDPVARTQAFASGVADIAMGVTPEDRATIAAAQGRLAPRPAPNVHFLAFVTTKESPLRDARVRRALNYAVDKSGLIDAFLAGAIEPASQISHRGAFGFNEALAPYPYDPAKARALLKDAGFPNGFAFTVVLDTAASGVVDWYQGIAQNLAAIGVKMTIRPTPVSRITEYVLKGNWPVEGFGWTFAGYDSLLGFRFRSCAMQPAYTCDPALMPLIAAAAEAPTEAARRSATEAALAAERDAPPGILLWRAVNFDALRNTVSGYEVVNDIIAWDKISLAPR